MKIKNEFLVESLIYEVSVFTYCPLGNDWGRVKIRAEIHPDAYLPDYVDIDNFVKEAIEGKTYITEKVGWLVHEYIKETIQPKRLKVMVHSENDSIHSCTTTIGG